MSEGVLRRFILLMAVATVVVFSVWAMHDYLSPPPGDYQVRQGDILLSEGEYDEAIERFDLALERSPNHRGALMGRAVALLQSGRHAAAEAELTNLISFLESSLTEDDTTGRGVLASAYANRGILYDRTARYDLAIENYIQALNLDEGAVDGPGLMHKIIYGNTRPSTVRDRAHYLQEQLALPEDERLLRIPAVDERQRMYKP